MIRRPFSWRTPDTASGLFIKQACLLGRLLYFKFLKSHVSGRYFVFFKANYGVAVCIDIEAGIFVYGLSNNPMIIGVVI